METSLRCCAVVGATAISITCCEGAALGSHQDPIRRFPESRVECTLLQIVVQSQDEKDWLCIVEFLPTDNPGLGSLPPT
jgi:hypothetical protein